MLKRTIKSGTLQGIGVGMLLFVLTAWLFYDFEVISVICIVFVPVSTYFIRKKYSKDRRIKTEIAFKDALSFMKNALDAGYSAENSVKAAVVGLTGMYGEKNEMTKEFTLMYSKITTGFTVEQVFLELGERTELEDVKNFAALFAVLKRTGGNLCKVIRQTVTDMKNRLALRRELGVVIAAKQGEFFIMSIIPHGILLYLRLFAPDFSAPLYHNSFGKMFMTCALVACGGLFWTGCSIIKRTLKV